MTPAEQAAQDLAWVAAYWPDLTGARLPGTARPWRQPELTPERRAELDAEARAERFEYRPIIPGEHAAPVDVAILDVMTSVLIVAEQAAAHVASGITCPQLPPPATAYADAVPYLDFAARHVTAADAADGSVIWTVEPLAAQMKTDLARALCLVFDGQRLDAECPWCHGGLVAGARSWRVRDLLSGQRCEHGCNDRMDCERCKQQVAIVCESDVCEPPQRDVGTWWRGRPCWPVSEWDWLAKRVQSADARRTMSA